MRLAWMLLAAVVACTDTTGVELGDLVGTWKQVTYRMTDPATGQDVVVFSNEEVTAVTMTITKSSTFSSSSLQARSSGTLVLDGNKVTTVVGQHISHGTITRNGRTLTIDLTEYPYPAPPNVRVLMVFNRT